MEKVKVKLFANLRLFAGVDELIPEIRDRTTLGDIYA